MANTLQTSIYAIQCHLGFWNPTIGTNNEPALSAANMVQQVMGSPPFHFPWNRNVLSFSCIQTIQDYTQAVTDFGWIEKAVILNPTTSKYYPVTPLNVTPLGESNEQTVPASLAVQQNNVGTSVWLRFLGVPDANYSATVWYQKFMPLMTGLSSPWVAPDYLSYIYNRGLLAHLYEARGDVRAQQEKIAFAAALLSTHEGLTDSEKNIFLAQYMPNIRAGEVLQLKTQQGVQARGQ